MKVIIWDDLLPVPENISGLTILWRNNADSDLPDRISIPELVEKNAHQLRNEFLKWVYDLGQSRVSNKSLSDHLEIEEGFSAWWMGLINEKCNYEKSPQIENAIRLLAFVKWSESKEVKKIHLFTQSKELALSLQECCKSKGIEFNYSLSMSSSKIKKPRLATFISQLPMFIEAFIWLLFYFKRNWALRGVGIEQWRNTKYKTTFVSYLFNLSENSIKKKSFESGFWSQLPSKLKDNDIGSNWLHIYINHDLVPGAKTAASLINGFNRNNNDRQIHVSLSSFISGRVFFSTLYDWSKLKFISHRVEKKIKSYDHYLWPLFKNDWRKSIHGREAISNLLTNNLFKSAFKQLPIQRNGVYLLENQGWEFGMIHAWKRFSHGTLVGFPHSTVRFWDLRYFFDRRIYIRDKLTCQMPMPDLVACNGPAAKEAYLLGGFPKDMIVEVESLRYLYINQITNNQSHSKISKERKLLVLGDYLESKTHKQLKLLNQTVTKDLNFSIYYKAHPACSLDLSEYKNLSMVVVTKPLSDIITQFDFVYTSSNTSAAVDAYCLGIPVLINLDPSEFNLSPLRGYSDIKFVENSEALIEIVNNLSSATQNRELNNKFFFLDLDLKRWLELLKEK